MHRRTFLGALVIPLPTAVSRVAAQQTHVARIGWLAIEPTPQQLGAFRQSLQTLGYVEGRTVMLEEHYAGGRAERLPDLAAELVRSKPDAIVTIGSASSLAAQRATTTLPIVFVVADPVASGLVKSLAHPGGNLTGLAIIAGELNGKRIELLKEALPSLARLAVLGDANAPGTSSLSHLAAIEAAARTRGIEVVRPLDVRSSAEFEAAFNTAVQERSDAILVLSSPLFGASPHEIVALAAKTKLPVIYEGRRFVEAGGLISYGPNVSDVLRDAAVYVDKILKGAKPENLPVERPRKLELVINMKTVKALGITIPSSLVTRADEVIQ